MEAKNLQYNALGSIDMEINHPDYGWIPFTASIDDTEQLGKDLYTLAVAGELGVIADYVIDPVAVENDRVLVITSKATELIEDAYPPLKQRKMMSQLLVIQGKQLDGATLTQEEIDLKASILAVNDWITAIRTIENTAIANGTSLELIDWTV